MLSKAALRWRKQNREFMSVGGEVDMIEGAEESCLRVIAAVS